MQPVPTGTCPSRSSSTRRSCSVALHHGGGAMLRAAEFVSALDHVHDVAMLRAAARGDAAVMNAVRHQTAADLLSCMGGRQRQRREQWSTRR